MHRGSVNSATICNIFICFMSCQAMTVVSSTASPILSFGRIIIKITFIFVFDTFGAVAMESKFNNNDNDDNDDADDNKNKDKQQNRTE